MCQYHSNKYLEVITLKRFVFLSLSLLLLILIPGCFSFPAQAPNPVPPVSQPSVIIFDQNSGKGSVMPPVGISLDIREFSSNPPAINSGGTSTLLWNVTGANSVSIDQGIGMVDVAGTRIVSPAISTVYTISATNASGTVTRSSLTTVNPAYYLYPGSFAVTSAIANTEPSISNGCFNLYANVTANGAGTATYIWESTDGGGYSYTWNVTFPSAGTQKITLPVDMSALPSGPYRIHVLTPNDIASDSTQYTTCP
jgi:hypothetical protein